jgi:hypothetical protein
MSDPDVVEALGRLIDRLHPVDADQVKRARDEIVALRKQADALANWAVPAARAEALEEAAAEAGKWATGKAARSAIRALKDRRDE